MWRKTAKIRDRKGVELVSKLLDKGLNYSQIGAIMDLTRERIRQIAGNEGLTLTSKRNKIEPL